jgi:hypothetical protein
MVKRLFWVTVGFTLGVWFTWRTTHAVRLTLERYVPPRVAERLRVLNTALEERQAIIRARRERVGTHG